jgi:RNA polymerase-binding protein DksA
MEDEKMDQEFAERMKEKLLNSKMELLSNLSANSEEFKRTMEELDPKDLVDNATDNIDRKLIESIGSQDMKQLKQIDSALNRIQQGKYGLCMRCGKRIPQDRLEAIPYALMCIECKSSEERRNR